MRMAVFGARGLHGSICAQAPKRLGIPVRQMLPSSLRSSPPSDPGRCGYLRYVPCALRQIVTPLDGLGVGARSWRNLACTSKGNLPPRDRAEIAYLHPGHPEALHLCKLQCGGGRRASPGDIQNARDGWVATISARMAAFAAWGLHGLLGDPRANEPQNGLGIPVC